jgi:hypothetical protein
MHAVQHCRTGQPELFGLAAGARAAEWRTDRSDSASFVQPQARFGPPSILDKFEPTGAPIIIVQSRKFHRLIACYVSLAASLGGALRYAGADNAGPGVECRGQGV